MRERLVALYAVNHEIARVRVVAREPGLAAIRLAWWRDALAAIHDGKPAPAHPALAAYARDAEKFAGASWRDLIEAEGAFLGERFASWDDVDAYLERTTGALFRLAANACGTSDNELPPGLVRSAALCWGYVSLLRWSRERLPGDAAEALERADGAYRQAHALARSLPAALFPAFGYVALAPAYLRALGEGKPELLLIARQLRLIGAAMSGRI